MIPEWAYEYEIERLTKEIDRLRAGVDAMELEREIREPYVKRLEHLCKASYHLLMGSDSIYAPDGDTGPTNWLRTRNDLLFHLKQVVEKGGSDE